MKEEALLFGKTESLVGVITHPSRTVNTQALPAIILLNSGLVHHVGLNRLHVKLARTLAMTGFVVLRFDFSGIGDSQVRRDHLPFQKSAIIEVQEAMDYLHQSLRINRFILMGICSGAAFSYKTALCDSRVAGIVLINPIAHLHGDDENVWISLRNRSLLRHYWRILLHSSFRAKNWRKALTGKIIGYRSILKIMFGFPLKIAFRSHTKEPPIADKATEDIQSLINRNVQIYIIHSEGDEGLDYLYVVLGDKLQPWIRSGALKLELIHGANHTFTLLWSQERLLKMVQKWGRGWAKLASVAKDSNE